MLDCAGLLKMTGILMCCARSMNKHSCKDCKQKGMHSHSNHVGAGLQVPGISKE